ncbi:HEXXH motif domain-containing protein [Actinoplanes italicus]|uniref:HEXXH motif-containing protein n=1 Tax=Actinoplanes italicus TaxID=113567 RepID=A0A2T0JDC2_9ACTN|nr:HEXXH motif domain-containing protein [Actinoplanes italicus]PRX05540.1 HEXXH motif-containing protein [Actinoplanes italicus]GIE35980.1 HEXXH motif domain-containing protein [Actinoplanes italicus]
MDIIRLSDDAFRRLAAGDNRPAVIGELADGQRSRRMVLLRALLDAAGDPATAGPLPSVAETWVALEKIQAAAPAALDAVLLHPQVGSWLAYTLRRHRGGASGRAPRHIDFGQLNTVALAAAALTGVPHRTVVPLRGGRVLVPRFGMATFEGCQAWDTAEAWTEDGRLRLRHGTATVDVPAEGDAPGWMALRSLTVGEDDLSLTVFVDDIDPWRDLADPVDPVRLTEDEFGTWAKLLQDAWTILVRHHRPVAEGLAAGFTSLAPLPAVTGWDTRSASTGDAFGAIMCSLPPDPVTLAVSLAHEFRHIALGGLMHLVALTEGPGEPCLYAPWRDDPRPAGGLLQGIYAFHGIAGFWRDQRRVPGNPHPRLDDFEYAYSRAQTREAIAIALADGNLTERGRHFVRLMAAAMDDWDADSLDPEAAELARLVADGHRAGWRIRHRHPDPGTVKALAAAWREQRTPPAERAPATVRPDPEMRHWSGARLGLARRRLLAPEQYAQAGRASWGVALSDADLDLFAGDAAAAAARFAAGLAADPRSEDAWTGLGLALQHAGASPAGDMLLGHPDLVMALHRELGGAADPAALAGWLAG